MYEKFEGLEEEKKKKIIDAALNEFNHKGYTSASTNTIIKNAEISKGALFSYFGNKEKLFYYLFDNIVEYFMKDMLKFLEGKEGIDIFDKILLATKWKFEAFIKEPKKFYFMANSLTRVPDNIAIEIGKKAEQLKKVGMGIMFTPESMNAFKEGLDPQQAMFIIFSTMEGLSNKYMQVYKGDYLKLTEDKEVLLKEVEDYCELLRKSFARG